MPWGNNDGGSNGGSPWQPKGQDPKKTNDSGSKENSSNEKSPWGNGGGRGSQGGGSGGGSPPDLEQLIKRGQERLQQSFSGGSGGFGIGILFAIGALIWALSGFYTVKTNEVGLNLVFGKFNGKTNEGLRYIWPYPIGSVVKVPVTDLNAMQVGSSSNSGRNVKEDSLMLTGDERIVDIDFTVFWQVKADAPEKFAFNLKAPGETIKAVAESAMREIVGRSQLRQIVSGAGSRSQVESDVRQLMQRVLDSYDSGVSITNINVRNLDVPQPVVDSFRDINAAGQDSSQSITQAQTYESQVIPKANGEAAQLLREAEGYRTATVAQAKGQASRFTKVLDEYTKAPDVTRERLFLETMERIFGGAEKLVIDSKAGNGVVPYLPLNDFRARTNSADTKQQ
jgi:modulator of FtsH protease HflK